MIRITKDPLDTFHKITLVYLLHKTIENHYRLKEMEMRKLSLLLRDQSFISMFRQNLIENPTRVAKNQSIALRNQSEAKTHKV